MFLWHLTSQLRSLHIPQFCGVKATTSQFSWYITFPMFVIYFDFWTVFYQATKTKEIMFNTEMLKWHLVYKIKCYIYLIFFNVMSKFDLYIRYSNSQQVFKKSSSWTIKCRLYNIKIKISLQEDQKRFTPKQLLME